MPQLSSLWVGTIPYNWDDNLITNIQELRKGNWPNLKYLYLRTLIEIKDGNSINSGEDFTEIKKEGRQINIYNVFPLYKNELEFKIENGYSAFLDLLIKANGNEILDIKRRNLLQKRSFWNKLMGNW